MTRKEYDDDDGRQIADMSGVEGSLYGFVPSRHIKKKKELKKDDENEERLKREVLTLTKKETRVMMFRAMWTSLLIGLIFVVLAALFILFASFIWFR